MTPIPPWFILKPLLRSTLLAWLSCRLLAAALLLLLGDSFWSRPMGSAFLLLTVSLLLALELRIQRLTLFLANLAVPLPSVLLLPFLVAVFLEFTIRSALDGSVVLATGHAVDALLDIADEVIWLTAGTTHGLGAPAAATSHGQFRREYLGSRRVPGRD